MTHGPHFGLRGCETFRSHAAVIALFETPGGIHCLTRDVGRDPRSTSQSMEKRDVRMKPSDVEASRPVVELDAYFGETAIMVGSWTWSRESLSPRFCSLLCMAADIATAGLGLPYAARMSAFTPWEKRSSSPFAWRGPLARQTRRFCRSSASSRNTAGRGRWTPCR